MRALNLKLLRDAFHMRSQFAAIAMVVASGIALFVSLRSMHGFLTTAQADYYERARFAHVFAQLKEAPEAVARRASEIPGVAAAEARVVADVLLDVPGLDTPAVGRLVSLPDPRRAAGGILNRIVLREGRLPDPRSPDEVVMSQAFAAANGLWPGSWVGAVIHGRWESLRVVGLAVSPEYIYEIRGGADIFPDNRRFGVVWMSREALARAFDLEGSFNDLAVVLAPGASESRVIAALDDLLAPHGGLGAYGRRDQISHRFVSDEIAETQVTSLFVPSIFLGVTAFLLHLVMSRLVGTQRDQIAVLKAFGYGRRIVAAHYTGLSLVPVAAGAIVGSVSGLWFAASLADIYARFFQFPDARFVPDMGVVAAGVLLGGGAAVLGALSAVWRATALPPAEAMRPEAPPRFDRGWLDRSGLLARLDPATKVVARHLARRPVRAVLSSLGIGMAFAIVLCSLSLFDSVETIRDIQFNHIQREDVAVAFRDPMPLSVRHELAHMPGVVRVEPYRAVAARLRNASRGNLSRRVSVQGLPPEGRLRRIVDRRMLAHQTSPDGLVVTTKLAQLLEVKPGDWLVMEVLEGRRPVRAVRVAALADELIGTGAYMEMEPLNRVLMEDDRVSGALLSVQRDAMGALFARLKRLAAVTGVVARRESARGFDRTISESFSISLTATVVFACVIAVGMIYNGARITLAERGREVASLRVLGFTRRETFLMLLQEQVFLTLMAVPMGLALGFALTTAIVWRFDSELFRMPLVITPAAAGWAILIVGGAAGLSALGIRRRVARLDLVEVLKTRE